MCSHGVWRSEGQLTGVGSVFPPCGPSGHQDHEREPYRQFQMKREEDELEVQSGHRYVGRRAEAEANPDELKPNFKIPHGGPESIRP